MIIALTSLSAQTRRENTGVLVIGGGTGGVAAGIQAARVGVKTMIVEQTGWLGGMLTAAGVSCTDGNNHLNSGIWQEFREALYGHYGTRDLATGWVSATCFEPRVGDSIFKAMASKEPGLTILYEWYFESVIKEENKVSGAIFKNAGGDSLLVKAGIVIDATDLGDGLASAGAGFDLGMEDPAYSGESMAPGKNKIIQDLTWVALLKDFGKTPVEFIRPVGYDSTAYFCSCSDAPCPEGKPYKVNAKSMLDYARLPNGYYMINWPAHGNDYYINAIDLRPRERERVYEAARQQTLGFVYFIQTTLGMKNLGLAPGYFPVRGGLALEPYHREGRRLKGIVRLQVNHLAKPYDQPEKLYRTGIAVGDYPVDHHHGQMKEAPVINFPKVNSFNIPLGTLVPDKTDGLIVADKGISVSNIVNGATRLQPCILLTGQAAGMLAAWCIRNDKQPREANIRQIQLALLDSSCYLMPYFDVDPSHPFWLAIQRVGITGIIRGVGKPEGWENKTLFYPDSALLYAEWVKGMKEYDLNFVPSRKAGTPYLTVSQSFLAIRDYCSRSSVPALRKQADQLGKADQWQTHWNVTLKLGNFNPDRPITRGEMAVLLYTDVLAVYDKGVDWKGNWIN